MDEPLREHIRDDLKGIIRGELLFDDLSRALYSTDASIFQVQPLGVVVPRDEADVQALVRYAADNQVQLIPRGAGSGLAGEALGLGLIVDLSRHFRAVLEIGSNTVRVQPGVVYRELNARLAQVGRRFAPDPASGAQCTIGGMVATDASGARLLRHGYTHEHVVALRVVLDTGEATTAGHHPIHHQPLPVDGRREQIVAGVSELLARHAKLIESARPRTAFDRCGYRLHDVSTPEGINLARLLVGSEGTLAITTEATLRTIPLPAARSGVLLGLSNLDEALRAARHTIKTQPSACELIDHRLLTLARGRSAEIAALVPAGVEAVLLVEYERDSEPEARHAATDLVHSLRAEGLIGGSWIAITPSDLTALWDLREAALPSLYDLRGGGRPIPLIEDVAVPLDELPAYLRRVQEILQREEMVASFLVHAGTGQVHTRPFLDLDRPNEVSRLWSIAESVHSLALELGGTVSSQHGTGIARTPWVARQYGPLYPIFCELKRIFDPRHLFNPGKIVGHEPPLALRSLRAPVAGLPPFQAEAASVSNGTASADADNKPLTIPLALRWSEDELRGELAACSGCGQCRTSDVGQRMCPIYRAEPLEPASPRAKVNLLRHVLRAGVGGPALSSDDVRDVADLCVNCKMCALECPAHINIPKLMLEAKAANVTAHGLGRAEWALARTESFAAFGSAFAFLVNAGLKSRTVRWLLEKLVGIARQRRLPAFAGRSFLSRAALRGWTRRPRSRRPRVAYFVDTFANYNDPQIGEALVAVLQHHGIEVYVPPGQVGCGMAPLAQGDVETARDMARTNLRVLAELAREGYPIICSEPTAALMLRGDYLDLFDDVDARLVAQQTVEATSFLADLHRAGRLQTAFQRLDLQVGHHVPCHIKALGPAAGPGLLELIPGLTVRTIDVSCSGMAGTFGLGSANYARSLRTGEKMLEELRRPEVVFGATECSPCRMQMEEGSRKRTLHPVQYLALAYGLMPELGQRLREPIRDRVLQ